MKNLLGVALVLLLSGAASSALGATAPAVPKSATPAPAPAAADATAADKSALAKVATPPTALPPAVARDEGPDTVMYMSNGLQLKAYLYRPQGDGPFPAILINHGSEPQPDPTGGTLNFWLSRGFVVFFPIRSGQGGNPGTYMVDTEVAALGQVRD